MRVGDGPHNNGYYSTILFYYWPTSDNETHIHSSTFLHNWINESVSTIWIYVSWPPPLTPSIQPPLLPRKQGRRGATEQFAFIPSSRSSIHVLGTLVSASNGNVVVAVAKEVMMAKRRAIYYWITPLTRSHTLWDWTRGVKAINVYCWLFIYSFFFGAPSGPTTGSYGRPFISVRSKKEPIHRLVADSGP